MKNLKAILGFLFLSNSANSQVHWLINQDSIASCAFIKSGKFINKITTIESTVGYYMVVKDSICTEYVEDGKYYLKSKIVFTSDCEYTSTILESTIPGYDIEIGSEIHTVILETSLVDRLIKIRSKGKDEWQELVLQKVE